MPPIDTILIPTDFSPSSARALAYACELADVHGAALHLLHVIEDPFTGGAYMGMMVAPPEGHFEHLEQQLRAKLTSLFTAEQHHKYAAMFVTRMGQPATEILNYVREHAGIDLIVITSAGHGAVARLVLGSVTDKIVRAAPCPVLVAHPHDRLGSCESRAA